MFTLLGSLLGFMGSIFPEILGLVREGQDNRHELAIMDRQIEMSKQDHIQRLEEIGAQADIAESQALYKHASKTSGVKWVEGLRASVRPVITYAFFGLFATVKGAGLYYLIHTEGVDVAAALIQIWDVETSSLFAAVMSFWFGQRALNKIRGGR